MYSTRGDGDTLATTSVGITPGLSCQTSSPGMPKLRWLSTPASRRRAADSASLIVLLILNLTITLLLECSGACGSITAAKAEPVLAGIGAETGVFRLTVPPAAPAGAGRSTLWPLRLRRGDARGRPSGWVSSCPDPCGLRRVVVALRLDGLVFPGFFCALSPWFGLAIQGTDRV